MLKAKIDSNNTIDEPPLLNVAKTFFYTSRVGRRVGKCCSRVVRYFTTCASTLYQLLANLLATPRLHYQLLADSFNLYKPACRDKENTPRLTVTVMLGMQERKQLISTHQIATSHTPVSGSEP